MGHSRRIEDRAAPIAAFHRRHKRMPSYAEIMRLFGFKSKEAVTKLVRKLCREGVLSKDRTGRLIPRRLLGEVRLLGTVEAGWPSPAEEELIDTMSLDEFLIEDKEATYVLKVKGDSMIEAGIMEGDMVLVERGKNPKEGDVVVAEIDGEWTIKYFRTRRGAPYLEPANKRYQPMFPKQTLNVAAVVKAVIRKY